MHNGVRRRRDAESRAGWGWRRLGPTGGSARRLAVAERTEEAAAWRKWDGWESPSQG